MATRSNHNQEITAQQSEGLSKIKHVALDMDGTIYLGNTLFPFTKDFLAKMSDAGIGYSFLTNNPSKSIDDYNVVLDNPSYPWVWNVLAQNVVIANDKRFCDDLIHHTDIILNWISAVKPEIIEEYFFKISNTELPVKYSSFEISLDRSSYIFKDSFAIVKSFNNSIVKIT